MEFLNEYKVPIIFAVILIIVLLYFMSSHFTINGDDQASLDEIVRCNLLKKEAGKEEELYMFPNIWG
jgi:hypothetical protein